MKNRQWSSELTLVNMLVVLFVAFKLAGIIDWSWWWVLSPIWILLALILVLGVAVGFAESKAQRK